MLVRMLQYFKQVPFDSATASLDMIDLMLSIGKIFTMKKGERYVSLAFYWTPQILLHIAKKKN